MIVHLVIVLSTVSLAANNEIPIIGILSQETNSIKSHIQDANYSSFISASYVKYVEAVGARAVPVWIGQDEEYYRNVVKYTNGLLLPGGGAGPSSKNGYWDAGRMLYRIACEVNRQGNYYPIIGICLGMELLAVVGAGKKALTPCSAQEIALPIKFTADFKSSRLFRNVEERTIQVLQTESLTYNNHRFCVTRKNFASLRLAKNWQVISTSVDKNGIEFISILEHKQYPFYGVQFHPEKNMYDHSLNRDVPHSENAIKVSQYFTNFFVLESRRNDHGYPTWEEEHKSLIYNYQPIFINEKNSLYEQMYLFK